MEFFRSDGPPVKHGAGSAMFCGCFAASGTGSVEAAQGTKSLRQSQGDPREECAGQFQKAKIPAEVWKTNIQLQASFYRSDCLKRLCNKILREGYHIFCPARLQAFKKKKKSVEAWF